MFAIRTLSKHAAILAACFAFSAPALAQDALFDGVRYAHEARTAPAQQSVHVLELDLTKTTLEVTPGDRSQGHEFIARTTSAYLTEFGLQAAVNAGYFTPFRGGSRGGDDYYPHAGNGVDVSGASISGEVEASPVETEEDERVNSILCIEGRDVRILDGQTCAPGTDHAMAAGPRLLASGENRSFEDFGAEYAANRHPRTAIGLNADRTKAWLVVVDGRQPGLSEGASLSELTDIFRALGAVDAMNFDGGGSTTLVVQDRAGPRIVNSPIHTGVPGRERPSANHLGVRAQPNR